jgi:hypothetical protein
MGQPLAKRAFAAQRRAQAIEYKLAGMSYPQIADKLNYSGPAHAARDICDAFEQAVIDRDHNVDVMIEEQIQILDRMRRSAWPAAVKGDTRSIDIVLKCVDRAVKLLRLSPEAQVNVQVFTVDAIERRINELDRQISLEGSQYEWSADTAESPRAEAPGGTEA